MIGRFRNSPGKAAKQFVFGAAGLAFITFAARLLHLQPGAISLLYLIVVVFVSLRAGFVSSVAVSVAAVVCLHYFFAPLFSPAGTKNPLAIVATAAFLITAWVITAMVARVRKLTEAQLTLRFEERLAERTRIARELSSDSLRAGHILQRLFSTFPEGWPGIGLVFLRVVAAIPPIQPGIAGLLTAPLPAPGLVVLQLAAASVAALLLVGSWTPVAGVLMAVAELCLALSHPADPWMHIQLGALGAALAMLGPGAFSVDAHRFGRKRIQIPQR